MKGKELLYLLGFRPRPQTYGHRLRTFDLPEDGRVEYAQWLHPKEAEKTITAEGMCELRHYLAPGDVAIDIGAHVGDSTLPLALAAGRTGCVLALEPNPYVFAVLQQNAALNPDRTRILPLPFAATPEDGELEFEYSDAGFCNGGLLEGVSRWRHAHAFRLTVQGRNLPAYLDREHPELLPRLRFIKTDAEGSDHAVLKTLARLLAQWRPYLRAEVFKYTSEAQRLAFHQFLTGLGYAVFRYGGDAGFRGEPVGPGDLMRWKHYDIFCVPRERA
jgi:FkbM family methyltransferase